jgi:hypothetical protein
MTAQSKLKDRFGALLPSDAKSSRLQNFGSLGNFELWYELRNPQPTSASPAKSGMKAQHNPVDAAAFGGILTQFRDGNVEIPKQETPRKT